MCANGGVKRTQNIIFIYGVPMFGARFSKFIFSTNNKYGHSTQLWQLSLRSNNIFPSDCVHPAMVHLKLIFNELLTLIILSFSLFVLHFYYFPLFLFLSVSRLTWSRRLFSRKKEFNTIFDILLCWQWIEFIHPVACIDVPDGK